MNPARLDYVQANDTCIQCHSQGRPLNNPIDGKYYDWPVGFDMGKKLSDYLETGGAQAGRNDLHPFRRRHRAQKPDAGQRLRDQPDVHARGHLLHLPRRARHGEQRRFCESPPTTLCLDCHGPNSPNGPHAPTIEAAHPSQAGQRRQRVHRLPHAENRPDHRRRECPQPHVPFRQPAMTETLKIPNACNVCHTDKTTAWATTP